MISFFYSASALIVVLFLNLLQSYLGRPILRKIPSPYPAALTNLWLLWQCRRGRRYLAVDEAHKKFGTFVRIQPNHVSVADAAAIPIIYGHGNGFLKSEYYDAFVSIQRGLFNTRDRAEHTRKRKIISHTFSAKNVNLFEPYIRQNLEEFVRKWDEISSTAQDGYAKIDSLQWFNYLAFDIIGDLAFGAPFRMLRRGEDSAEVRETPESPPTFVSAIQVLNRRGEVSATLGCLPQLKPYAMYLPDPFFRNGLQAVANLAGIAVARVNERLKNEHQVERLDLLSRLMEGQDSAGNPLQREELTAEALTQMIAGSDTTSNTSCALLFHILHNPEVLNSLQKELDQALPNPDRIPEFATVGNLPYLQNVINETLRIHSTSSLGLPRIVPPGTGVEISGHRFPPGSVLSVPSYTIHHSQDIWGPDAEKFRPSRWNEVTDSQRAAFIPFSYGPRACVGRNVAEMELALIVSVVCRRYEFELYQDRLETREGFLRKPLKCMIGIRKRTS